MSVQLVVCLATHNLIDKLAVDAYMHPEYLNMHIYSYAHWIMSLLYTAVAMGCGRQLSVLCTHHYRWSGSGCAG